MNTKSFSILFILLITVLQLFASVQNEETCGEVVHIKGTYDKQLVFGKATKKVYLEGCNVQCDTSYAIVLKNKKVKLYIVDGTENHLGDAGIKARKSLHIYGSGTLVIDSKKDGHKGMNVGKHLTVNDNPKINVTTSGKALKQEEVKMPDFFGGQGGPHFGPPGLNAPNDTAKTKRMGMPMDNPMGGFKRYSYEGSAKGIKVKGNITINGGDITIKTSTPGAEGLEANDTLTVNGGKLNVNAHNDAISVGKLMIVNGGDIYAESLTNDAIDINGGETSIANIKPGENPMGFMPDFDPEKMKDFDPSKIKFDPDEMRKMMEEMLAKKPVRYIQTGGNVTCKTNAGAPEEALDVDMTRIQKTGGTLTRIPEESGFGPFGGGMPGQEK